MKKRFDIYDNESVSIGDVFKVVAVEEINKSITFGTAARAVVVVEREEHVDAPDEATGERSGMIEIVPISDDNGFAVCLGELRVDVFPPNEIDAEAFVSITEPRMSMEDVRRFALLLLAAVEFAEGKWKTY